LSAYRFCRTDDIGLLVDALNRCWAPHFPGEPPMTAATFKRSIRDLQVWCSSCMVAFAGAEPIGVLIGAKRPSSTLIYRIAIHPDHLRQGHARHMLTSLSSKLSILGPSRIIAEVPEALAAAYGLFAATGYVEEARLTDYIGVASTDRATRTGLVIPVTVEDLAANDLLAEQQTAVCWERSVETLKARKDDIVGVAVASHERIEAYILYIEGGHGGTEVLSLRTVVDDGGARMHELFAHLAAQGVETVRVAKVHPAEIPDQLLRALGLEPTRRYGLCATKARPG
jgi:hypothetical protein